MTLHNSQEQINEKERQERALAVVGKEMQQRQDMPFALDVPIEVAVPAARQLASVRDKGDAQLSFLLFSLSENKAFLEQGFQNFNDYVEEHIGISSSKARALVNRWKAFIELGLNPAILGGDNPISWDKFGDLMKGVKEGIITDENIDVWLPRITMSGELALPSSAISHLVNLEINMDRAEENPDGEVTMSFKTDNSTRQHIANYMDVIGEATGQTRGSEIIANALEAQVTAVASDTEDVRQNLGLTRLKDIAERMAPGVRVLFVAPQGPEFTEQYLGVVPVTALYSTHDNGRFTLATSKEEAVEVLGTMEIVEHPLLFPEEEVLADDDDAEYEVVE